jgi:hypothetical protein
MILPKLRSRLVHAHDLHEFHMTNDTFSFLNPKRQLLISRIVPMVVAQFQNRPLRPVVDLSSSRARSYGVRGMHTPTTSRTTHNLRLGLGWGHMILWFHSEDISRTCFCPPPLPHPPHPPPSPPHPSPHPPKSIQKTQKTIHLTEIWLPRAQTRLRTRH